MDLPLTLSLVAAFGIGLYVLADGFDLGIGILFLIAPRDADRDVMMESISPYWDGNETWLVLGAALLLAAFPAAYYVLLPAFYLPIMIMLFALIFRGIAFEFRFHAGHFRRAWDYAFAAGSLLATLMQGCILGGFIQGVPVQNHAFAGGTFGFFSVLGLGSGVGLVGGYTLLGAGWLIGKTEGATQIFGREVGRAAILLTAAMMAMVSIWTALTEPMVADRWFSWSHLLPLSLLPLTAAVVIVLLWHSLWGAREWRTFILGILLFLLGFGGLAISLFPYIVPYQETIWTAAADPTGLRFVGIGLAVLLPIILAYSAHAYWVFRGKAVTVDDADSTAEPAIAARRSAALTNELHLS